MELFIDCMMLRHVIPSLIGLLLGGFYVSVRYVLYRSRLHKQFFEIVMGMRHEILTNQVNEKNYAKLLDDIQLLEQQADTFTKAEAIVDLINLLNSNYYKFIYTKSNYGEPSHESEETSEDS
jgi:hypothetical protein